MRKRLALAIGTVGVAAALIGGGAALAATTGPGRAPGPVPSGSFSVPPRPTFSVPPRPSGSVPVPPSGSPR